MNLPEDKPLSKALKQWQVTERTAPRFREAVWRRIAAAEAETRPDPAWGGWFAGIFAKPVFAAAYLTVLLAAGLTAGYLRGEARQARANDELAARYVQALDPFQHNAP